MVRLHHWLNGHELVQTPGDSEGQGSLACCSPWDQKELDTTQQLNKKNLNYHTLYLIIFQDLFIQWNNQDLHHSIETFIQDRNQYLLHFHPLASSSYKNYKQGSQSTELLQAIIYLSSKRRIWQGEFGKSEMRVVRLTVTNGMQLFSKSLEPRGSSHFSSP